MNLAGISDTGSTLTASNFQASSASLKPANEAPFISKIPALAKSSPVQRLIKEYSEYQRACQTEEMDRIRLFDNIGMYMGIEYSQWNREAAQALLAEQRHPTSINLTRQKVDTLAGAVTSNQYDVEFVPLNGKNLQLTNTFRDVYNADKNTMKWDKAFMQAAKLGLIYRGDEQMYIDDRFDPAGNISFRAMAPGYVTYAPDWITDDVNDCDVAFILGFMPIERMANTYDKSVGDLKLQMEMLQGLGKYFDKVDVNLGKNPDNRYRNLLRVIEKHQMVNVKTKRLIAMFNRSGEQLGMNGLPFPVMDPKKDVAALRRFGEYNDVDWESVVEVPYTDRLLNIYTFSPDVSLQEPLEDKPAKVQIRRLDLFPWAPVRMNGKWSGIVDITKDIQQTINKNQSQKNHMINSAANGAKLINENLAGGDKDKLERIKRNLNNPAFVEDVDLDSVQRTHVILKENAYDAALFGNEEFMIRMMDYVTPVPAAMSGRDESSRESGVLYQSKVAIAEVGMKAIYESLKEHQLAKAEAYLLQAQITYRDSYRLFEKADRSGYIELNRSVEVDGNKMLINDISQMPRCNVIIKTDPNGLMMRHMNREQYTEMMRVVPPQMALLQTFLASKLIATNELSDEDRKELEVVTKMEMVRAAMAIKTELANMQASSANAEMSVMQIDQQIQQLMAGPQQQQIGPGGQNGSETVTPDQGNTMPPPMEEQGQPVTPTGEAMTRNTEPGTDLAASQIGVAGSAFGA